jgi:hypothetical protein
VELYLHSPNTALWRVDTLKKHRDTCNLIFYRVMKSRRMRWAGYVTRMRQLEMNAQSWSGNLKGSDHFEDPGVDGRVMLE